MWGSPYTFLTPVLEFTAPSLPEELIDFALMVNSHSDGQRTGPVQDAAYECALHLNSLDQQCAVLSGFTEPLPGQQPDARAALTHPIYPGQNRSEVVGFVTSLLAYNIIIASYIPINTNGILYVIQTDDTTLSYEISNGVPQYLGTGDLHDSKYDKDRRVLDIKKQLKGLAQSLPETYTISFYPTQELEESFVTNLRWGFCFGAVALIIAASIIFGIYDFFMERESNEQHAVLETKRRFVRFISHEVRTPLNAVSMASDLMLEQVK